MSWEVCTLGDVVTLKRGHDLPKAKRVHGPVPVVSSSGITGHHNEAKAEPPGVVTGRYGTIGEVFFVTEPYWPLNTALYAIDFHGNDPRFVAYFLRDKLRNYQSDKAAVPGVDRNVLHKLPARCPDLQQQQKIVALLSAYDDLIANNNRRIELLEQSVRLLFREWFVYLRFPGHEHADIVGGVPKDWKSQPVQTVCERYSDGDWLETKDQGGDDYRILQISNIGQNEFIETGNQRFITEDTFKRLRCTEVVPGDIIVSRMPAPIGRGWMVTDQPFRMVTAVDVTIVRPGACVDAMYLLYHINSQQNLSRCEGHATGATRPRISRKNMGKLPIMIPPWELQNAFSEFAEPIHKKRARLFEQNRRLIEARDHLLPRLMDGRLEV
ncbi:restriction endonuclease subunit S [Acidimangrovimonas pyrenivorans]|uniref:Restriction endonuclease subunit S n=1 Tax=Acidimangrovimonas pyrenivorans TaxID=2030798 RepID=A0ABV7AD14_9RHOB